MSIVARAAVCPITFSPGAPKKFRYPRQLDTAACNILYLLQRQSTSTLIPAVRDLLSEGHYISLEANNVVNLLAGRGMKDPEGTAAVLDKFGKRFWAAHPRDILTNDPITMGLGLALLLAYEAKIVEPSWPIQNYLKMVQAKAGH